MGIIRRICVNLPRNTLLSICKSFVRTYLDCGNILYDKSHNENVWNMIKKVQFRAYLLITGIIQETS